MPSKHFIDDRSSFVDAPPPSLAVASPLLPGASKGGHYIGTYGRPPVSPLRRPAKARARRSLIVASIRLIQRFAQARRRTRAAIQKANSKARRCAISLGKGAVICYFAAPPPPSATGPLPGALLGAPRGGFRVPAGGRWRYNRRCSVKYGTPAVERSAVWLGPHAIAGKITRKAVWPYPHALAFASTGPYPPAVER